MYKLKFDRFGHKAGTIVYDAKGATYGLASTDEMYTGIPHTCVTLDENGGTPFFTIPTEHLESVS